MTVETFSTISSTKEKSKIKTLWRSMWRRRWLYFLIAPTLIYFMVFKYGPLWNAQIAFKDFKPLLGVLGSPWVGLQHFESFINSYYFSELMVNTVFFSLAKLFWVCPLRSYAPSHCMKPGWCASAPLYRPRFTCRTSSRGSSCSVCCSFSFRQQMACSTRSSRD